MSVQTKVFLYHQRHRVILLDTSGAYFTKGYQQVYTNNLKAHRGTDNQILIEFVNQDQKAVDVTGKEFTCRLISHDGSTLLLEKPLVSVNDLRGQTKLVLTEQELDSIMPQTIGFSVEQVASGRPYEPVFVDDHAGGRGRIDIMDSIMPSFTASKILSIPDHGVNTTYVTSVLETDAVSLHTFQFTMAQFTGEIAAEGTSDIAGPWYQVQLEVIAELSDLHTFSVNGFHPYIRFTITEETGTVETIQYR